MDLATQTQTGVSLVDYREVFSYEQEGSPCLALCRLQLGSQANPVAGGSYVMVCRIDGIVLAPKGSIGVDPGEDAVIATSRQFLLRTGEVLTVEARGTEDDTSVDTVCILTEVTPLAVADVIGLGGTPINHNFGGTDNLAYKTTGGAGIDNAVVEAFTQEDYNAERRTSGYVKGRTTTGPQGRWLNSLMLDPGTYVIRFHKQALYGPDTVTITVET